eukprot:GFYU01053015.1.p1 GENE.GFYU01053015.1~~GFYU01053015.1.p1  ORF type:complete len:194 (+),score=32.80 GFYU01053015.1:59-583(+)
MSTVAFVGTMYGAYERRATILRKYTPAAAAFTFPLISTATTAVLTLNFESQRVAAGMPIQLSDLSDSSALQVLYVWSAVLTVCTLLLVVWINVRFIMLLARLVLQVMKTQSLHEMNGPSDETASTTSVGTVTSDVDIDLDDELGSTSPYIAISPLLASARQTHTLAGTRIVSDR